MCCGYENAYFVRMYLHLNHKSLIICGISKDLVLECYRLIRHLPKEEHFVMAAQIRRAALSVHLNIAEGASRKSLKERKRFYEIARSSLIEIDAALDIADSLAYLKNFEIHALSDLMLQSFKILTSLINHTK